MPNVVIPKAETTQYDLPPVCVVTGATEGVVFKEVKFTYVPPWARIFGWLIQALVMKRHTAELPFTDQAYRSWRTGLVLFPLILIVSFVAGIGGGAVVGQESHPELMLVGIVGAIVVSVLAYFKFARNKGPRCVKIDERNVEVFLPSPQAVAAIQERLSGGGRQPRAQA